MILRSTRRLSFSDCAPGIEIVSLRIPTTMEPPNSSSQRRTDRLQLVGLDDVAFAQLVESFDSDAALEALVDFLDVILEAPERCDLAAENRLRVALHADVCGAGDLAVGDRGAGDGAELGHVEERLHAR